MMLPMDGGFLCLSLRRAVLLGSLLAINIVAASFAAAADADAALVARGKYVAVEADCVSCHSAPNGKPYAGGYPLKSPLGILYGPNITSDKETGIGTWTRADFEKALRQGVAKDGSYLYPAMPYQNYAKMTDADLAALWAYVRTIPAVHNTPPKDTLPFPFNIRTGLAAWQALYLQPGLFAPDPHHDAQWNRGAYLVEVMGHCSQCHTPRNIAMGFERQHVLGGAQIEGWYAPDIGGDAESQIHKWNATALARYLKTGLSPNNARAVGPMWETISDSLSKMTNADLTAIAVYLEHQPTAEPEAASKVRWAGDRSAAGSAIYATNCSGCHQANGKGIAGSVPALAGDGAVTAREPYNVIMSMLEGFAPHGTYGAMGSFANALSDDQIADVTNYVRTAWGNAALPNATPWGVSSLRKTAATSVNNETHELLCPDLSGDLMQPALKQGAAALKRAASDNAELTKVIDDYRAARPKSSPAQVVEVLSTAYCRAVGEENLSESVMSAQVADFAQQVAIAVGKGAGAVGSGQANAQKTT